MATLDQRFEDALKLRTKLVADVQRIQGKKEAAQATLKAAEEACRAKKIDPEKIDEKIKQLEDKYEELVSRLEEEVAEAKQKLAPFLGES